MIENIKIIVKSFLQNENFALEYIVWEKIICSAINSVAYVEVKYMQTTIKIKIVNEKVITCTMESETKQYPKTLDNT
jgi:hypothetical protein